MTCIWYGDVLLMAVSALLTAGLVQHLCQTRGLGTGMRLSGWALGAGLIAVAALIFGDTFNEEWARSCGQGPPEFMGGTLIKLTLAGRLVVWSAAYATVLAAFWLSYRLVAPRQRANP